VRMGAQCGVPEYSLKVADTDRIQTMISIAQSISQDITHIN
jgi:hypothetical protein